MPRQPKPSAATDARTLHAALSLYDGRHTDLLERIAADHTGEPGWIDALLDAAEPPEGTARSGAIWLLRHARRRHQDLTPDQARRIIALLAQDRHWEQTLNLLQILDTMPIPAESVPRLLRFLDAAAAHERPFVRAWAISALIKIGGDLSEHRRRIADLADRAESQGPASVRARIRRARAEAARTPPARTPSPRATPRK